MFLLLVLRVKMELAWLTNLGFVSLFFRDKDYICSLAEVGYVEGFSHDVKGFVSFFLQIFKCS